MPSREAIEDFARLTGLSDAQDLMGLVTLQENLFAPGDKDLAGDFASLVVAATRFSEIIDEIFCRNVMFYFDQKLVRILS